MMIYPSNIKPIPESPTHDHDQSRLDSARLNSTWTSSALLSLLLQLETPSPCLTESTSLDSLCFSTYYLLQRYPPPSSSSLPIKIFNPKTIHYTQPNLTWLVLTWHITFDVSRLTFDVCHLHQTRLPLFHVSTPSVWRLLGKWSACVATTDTQTQNSSSSSNSFHSSCISYTTQLAQWIMYHC